MLPRSGVNRSETAQSLPRLQKMRKKLYWDGTVALNCLMRRHGANRKAGISHAKAGFRRVRRAGTGPSFSHQG
jgi:hypothetical protein